MNIEEKYAIANILPSMTDYKKTSKDTTQFKEEIIKTVELWLPKFKRAILSKQTEEPWQRVLKEKFDESKWNIILKGTFVILNIRPRITYFTYEAIMDLDSWIFRVIHPLPPAWHLPNKSD
jgi:hypothetical protein